MTKAEAKRQLRLEHQLDKKSEAERKFISEWYHLKPILGYANWALFYILLGGREAGKSYSVTDYFVQSYVEKGIPFTWIRLSDRAANKLLANNAEKLIDPDIRRRYGLDLLTSGNNVYEVRREKRKVQHKDGSIGYKSVIAEKKLMARVYALATYYNDKGSIFDKDFLNDQAMQYHIAIDEFQREKNEKNTFDILYALVNQLENLIRSTKQRTKIFFLGNTLEEASDILCAFNFIPEKFGIFKLKKKRAVIQNIEPSEEYKARRKGTVADILLPTASTFTNKIETDNALVDKSPLKSPVRIIKFHKEKKYWFTVWNSNIICKWNGEKKPVIAMRPYLDEVYVSEKVNEVITQFDTRCFKFRNLITFKEFQSNLEMLKPRK